MNTRKKGAEYEQVAMEYLRSQQVVILEHNYRNRKGEIDIIGRDAEYTVFFEVKFRKDNCMGYPVESVNYGKQRTICRVADYYRMTHHMGEFSPVRYDVVAICGEEIMWYKNAFEHIY